MYFFQIFKNQQAFEGYCELRTNNDPWLMLAPAKVRQYF